MDAEIKKLKEENQNLRNIIDVLMFGYNSLCEADLATEIVEFFKLGSPIFEHLGMKGDLPPYDTLIDLYVRYGVSQEDREKVRHTFSKNYLRTQLAIGESVTVEYRNEKGMYGQAKLVKIGEDKILAGFTEMDKEIRERKKQIYTDSLTGIYNRKYYDEHLSSKMCMALVISDVDSFKSINDSYGHLCGDEVLALVADTLQSSIRETDEVVRYGGDEFIIIFQNVNLDQLETRMENIRHRIEALRLEKYPDVRIRMSFGVAFGTGKGKELIVTADEMLYKSKEKKNTVTIKEL